MDRERLTKPVSDDSPGGENLQSLRQDLHRAIRSLLHDTAVSATEGTARCDLTWDSIKKTCLAELETRTKDLYLAVYFLLSSIRIDGAAGIADGVWLLKILHEEFWEEFYPPIGPDGDLTARAKAISRLNSEVEYGISELALSDEPEPLNLYTYTEIKKEEERLGSPRTLTALAKTDRAFYESGVRHLEAARADCDALSRMLSELYGDYTRETRENVNVSELQKAVRIGLGCFNELLKSKGVKPEDSISPVDPERENSDAIPPLPESRRDAEATSPAEKTVANDDAHLLRRDRCERAVRIAGAGLQGHAKGKAGRSPQLLTGALVPLVRTSRTAPAGAFAIDAVGTRGALQGRSVERVVVPERGARRHGARRCLLARSPAIHRGLFGPVEYALHRGARAAETSGGPVPTDGTGAGGSAIGRRDGCRRSGDQTVARVDRSLGSGAGGRERSACLRLEFAHRRGACKREGGKPRRGDRPSLRRDR